MSEEVLFDRKPRHEQTLQKVVNYDFGDTANMEEFSLALGVPNVSSNGFSEQNINLQSLTKLFSDVCLPNKPKNPRREYCNSSSNVNSSGTMNFGLKSRFDFIANEQRLERGNRAENKRADIRNFASGEHSLSNGCKTNAKKSTNGPMNGPLSFLSVLTASGTSQKKLSSLSRFASHDERNGSVVGLPSRSDVSLAQPLTTELEGDDEEGSGEAAISKKHNDLKTPDDSSVIADLTGVTSANNNSCGKISESSFTTTVDTDVDVSEKIDSSEKPVRLDYPEVYASYVLPAPSEFGGFLTSPQRVYDRSVQLTGRKYVRFSYARQGGKVSDRFSSAKIKAFDFATPSPDDYVRSKRKSAFQNRRH